MLLRPVIENALESVRPAAKAKDIALECAIPNSDIVVRGDASRLQQVIWNLLSNSVKFTPRQGRVQISVVEQDGNALLSVTDTGQGIAPEFLPCLFERFKQADGSITRRHGGLGLGLAIVRHIVEMHGGTVSAASEGPGKGSTFSVTLPMESNAIVVRERPAPGGRTRMLDGLKVLVVEDDADTRSLIAMVLEESGAKVLSASCVTEALQFVEHDNPDVMISDIGMAEEDGYSLIRKIRLREATMGRHLPAAALTAYAKTEDRAAALAAGFEDHVAKPVEPERLPILVAELAKRRM
jgi:CheY-like chemotaxis protein